MSVFAERLKTLRNRASLTQEEIASQVGMSLRGYQKYEMDEGEPTMKVIMRLAEILQTTSDYLIGRSQESAPELSEQDLTPAERRLIAAVRRGTIVEALQTFTELTQTQEQSRVSRGSKAVNG